MWYLPHSGLFTGSDPVLSLEKFGWRCLGIWILKKDYMVPDPKNEYPPQSFAWCVWGLGALLYLTGFFHRVAPAVMTDQLMSEFDIGAAILGNFSAFYFYSYVAMQIPTGIFADLWGPRKLLTGGAFISSIGTLLFALSPTVFWANAGRLLIGGSVAVAYVSMLKLATHWFPTRMFAAVGGLALFCGVMGAVSAGVPLRFLVDYMGWRSVMFSAAGISLFLTAAIFWVVRDTPEERGFNGYAVPPGNPENGALKSLMEGLKTVLTFKTTWLLSLAPAGMVGPILAFAGLWGVPFLICHYGFTPAESAAITSLLMVAWAVGGPVLGGLSDRIGRRKPLYLGGSLISVAVWAVLVFAPRLPTPLLICLIFAVGFASGAMIIGFAWIRESVPAHLSGTVAGVCNMGVMTGPMILQPAIGTILERRWNGMMENGARVYDLAAYQSGFTLIIGFSVATCVLLLVSKETHCKQLETIDSENG